MTGRRKRKEVYNDKYRSCKKAVKLYELEERLAASDFIRISKSCIVNFCQIRSLRPEFGGRMIHVYRFGYGMLGCASGNGREDDASFRTGIIDAGIFSWDFYSISGVYGLYNQENAL